MPVRRFEKISSTTCISSIRHQRGMLSTERCWENQARGWRSLMRSGEKTTDRLEVGCCTVGDRIYRRGRHEDSYIRVPGEIAEPLGDTIRNEF